MRLVVWLLRGFVFFTLFAFALNNLQPVTVHWFFGAEWRAPLVIVVLAAFAGGCAVGVLAMLPRWWRRLRAARVPPAADAQDAAARTARAGAAATGAAALQPPREAL